MEGKEAEIRKKKEGGLQVWYSNPLMVTWGAAAGRSWSASLATESWQKKKRISETRLNQNEHLNSSFWLPVIERNGDKEETMAKCSRAVRDQCQTGVRPLQDGRVGLRLCTCLDMRWRRVVPLQDAPLWPWGGLESETRTSTGQRRAEIQIYWVRCRMLQPSPAPSPPLRF